MVKMIKMTQNIPFCTERLNVSTFDEPKSQRLSVDYTQASKMNKITGIHDRKH